MNTHTSDQSDKLNVPTKTRASISALRSLVRFELFLLALGCLLCVWQLHMAGGWGLLWDQIKPVKAYDFSFTTEFEPDHSDVNIYTFFPASNARQKVLTQTHINNAMRRIEQSASGQMIHWIADNQTQQTKYQARILTKPLEFSIASELLIPERYARLDASEYLSPTENIQSDHPEIRALWDSIKPEKTEHVLDVLNAIFQYTYEGLEVVDFKGTTDALTAARLGVASCNGKSRLFVALARLNNLPARLVGGVIMDGIEKKTSHQWVEVYVQGYWIPFGPTNGHFASLPDNYLQLYTGDHALIRHTSNINFDYRFDSEEQLVSPVFYPGFSEEGEGLIVKALQDLKMSPKTIGVVLLFPLCSLLITFFRNVVGVKTFGIFMPMLIASACFYTGLLKGAIGFSVMLLFACAVYGIAERMQLLKTARLAIVLTCIVALLLTFILYADADIRFELGLLSVFPVVIISFIAERLNQSMGESEWRETLLTCLGTILTVLACYALFQSILLKNLFASLPSLFLIVLALQVYLGKWSGIRLSESLRFRQLLASNNGMVAGINSRNRDIIYPYNDKKLLRLAADKLATKEVLKQHDIPVPKTLLGIANHREIEGMEDCINRHTAFALKPNKGCQGNGIVVITGKDVTAGVWQGAGDRSWSLDALANHVSEILSGAYSQSGDADIAYLEPLLIQHTIINAIAPYGLSDIRIIVANGKILNAMLRMPTRRSKGKANLHQGAIGVAVDHHSGKTNGARFDNRSIDQHPDTGANLIGIQIPYWDQIIDMAEKCYDAIPLGYLGVDICIDQREGPLVLEVNGRPGLEIQNVNNRGFYEDFMEKMHV